MPARERTVAFLFLFFLALLALPAVADIQTRSFSGDGSGHASLDEELERCHDLNLLAFPGAKLVANRCVPSSQASMLVDGSAGEWVGEGRIWASGKPGEIVFQLDRPRRIEEIRILTSNSDARANQDFEVILDDKAVFSSGSSVLGCDSGPFISIVKVGGEEKYQKIAFRIWQTYPVAAGQPGKEKSSANSWCSLVELQALADENDPELFATQEERDDFARRRVERETERRFARLARLTNGVSNSLPAMDRALDDFYAAWSEKYASSGYREKFAEFQRQFEEYLDLSSAPDEASAARLDRLCEEYEAFRRVVLLSNPLLDDFDELLIIRRGNRSPRLGLPYNWESNSSLPKNNFDDAIVRVPVRASGEGKVVYKPEKPVFVGDVDLHWDGEKILFSSVGTHDRWQVFEYALDGSAAPRELTAEQPDVDSYDACYLPDDRIIYTSTAIMAGVPCVYGSSHIATLFRMNADGSEKRQLAFDQEHSWNPALLNNGRVVYQRWEYADIPHSNSRQLFHCNPDGTSQLSYYGSNSYWPNSLWYPRAVPGHRSMVASVITGHHDSHRAGELVLLDPAKGRFEAEGCVQRIPGWGKKVEPLIRDALVQNSWPKFLHPYPLSEKYLIVAMKPNPSANWGIYLVDVFDNLLLLREESGYALMEPIPIRKTPRPPVLPDRVDLSRKDADVYIADIYNGPGLKDVPRGTVKKLRLFTYHFSYQNMGGLLGIVGVDGPWDIKQVLGTVPVNEDGSVRFRIPANTPISLQPLDESGQALQLMRSWLTAMPGEVLQCNGCHEDQNQAALPKTSQGFLAPPAEITPWYGERRGFAYPREVQPVIDKYCLDCHDGASEGFQQPDLRGDVFVKNYHSILHGNGTGYISRNAHFSVGYFQLQRYVRRSGIESDMHLLEPKEFSADTTELVQILRNGHYGVQLSPEAWERILTWIDLNCPYHGTWAEATKNPDQQRNRRIELAKLYANLDEHDAEAIAPTVFEGGERIRYSKEFSKPQRVVDGVRFESFEPATRKVDLGGGHVLVFVKIPAGSYRINGETHTFSKPFWISATEISNAQFAQFDPHHDSRVESKHCYQFGIHGYPMNNPEQPVCRVSAKSADEFCAWLSRQTGNVVRLPSTSEWEWAARAGAVSDFCYGDLNTDFGPHANLADREIGFFATNPYTVDSRYSRELPEFDDWIPADKRFNDKAVLSIAPGSYSPNAWGLYDVHGNVAEWTSTRDAKGRRVAVGGSWYDRPYRAAFGFERYFPEWQRVFDVGFRVIIEENIIEEK